MYITSRGQVYIGQSKNIKRRISQHKRILAKEFQVITRMVTMYLPGGILAREAVEQLLIDTLDLDTLRNKKNPLGGRLDLKIKC